VSRSGKGRRSTTVDGAPPPGARLAEVEELEVTIEKLVAGGEGLARWEGVPIFVPRSAPGDRLRVHLTDRRPDYGRGEIVEIVEPGPGRREPPCPYFERCGGCDLQHLEDALQVRLKAQAVVETLSRLGRIGPPENLRVIAGDAWGYRLRTQLHADRPEAETRPRVGYFARGSHDLVPVDSCPILVPELEDLLPGLPGRLARGSDEAERPPRRIDLAAGDGGRLSAAPVAGDLPHGEISIEVGGFTYRFDARCFFQTHRGLLGTLVETALGESGPAAAEKGGAAYDLYCGVGLFTLPLARRYRTVVGVEGDRLAVRYARRNVRAATSARPGARPAGSTGSTELGDVEIEGTAVESWVRRLPEGVDRVVADPPRAGLKGPVLKALLEKRPRWITYVSCHPAALARDLAKLVRIYRLDSLTLIDLFPQSGHMEAVVQLRLES
jgi:23S rRNA (uracil1939-C5)-methyltransferase